MKGVERGEESEIETEKKKCGGDLIGLSQAEDNPCLVV
jgi:hypothetical protein